MSSRIQIAFAPVRGVLFGFLGLLVAGAWVPMARAVDIEATGMEITQAVQNLDNDVRLVAKKNTWVRVHARSVGGGDVPQVVTRLIASRVAPGPVTFLGFLDSPPTTVTSNPLRTNINSSFNIQVPYSWRRGTVHFFALVDFPADVAEENEDNNVLFAAVNFEEVPPLRVRLFGVDPPNAELPGPIHYTQINSWLRRAFPTSALLVDQNTLTTPINVNNPLCNCTRDMNGNCAQVGFCMNNPNRACNDDDNDCGCGFLNEILLARRKMDEVSDPGYEPDRRYAALVHDGGGFMRGCSPGADAKVAAGPVGSASNGWDFDGSYADWYTGHELGHAYGRPHSGCCGAPSGGPYPYPMCAIGDSTFAGFDSQGPLAFSANRRDVMSYCNSLWISDYTYEAILDRLLLEDGDPPPPVGILGSYALAVGNVSFDLGTGSLSSFQPLPSNTRAHADPPGGDWEIRFLDASGATLGRHPFTPHAIEDDHDLVVDPAMADGGVRDRSGVFAEIVALPNVPVHTLALFHGATQVHSLAVSASAPTVTILSPNGGESLDRSATVTWTASDADNDPLTAALFYSADDGASWHMLSGQLTGVTSLDVDLRGLPGSSLVRFRVDVSDGFLGASDTSDDVLQVANAEPQVFVTSPGSGDSLAVGQVAMFEGLAHDAEDGALEGDSLVWSSDRQGTLGTGAYLELGAVLVPGTHVITLTATDTDGATATTSITLTKGDAAADSCPAYPREDCDPASAAKLKLSAKPGATRKLSLSLQGTQPRDPSVFGDPSLDATEVVCLYEAGRLRDTILVEPSATLWAATKKGFQLDRRGQAGVERMTLKAGSLERPAAIKASLRGQGDSMPALRSMLELPVVVQLGASTNDACVSAELDAASIRRNGEGTFSAAR